MKTKQIAMRVVNFLGAFALVGLIGTFVLIYQDAKGELVAMLSGLTGTALGAIGGLLSKTENDPSEDSKTL